MYTVGQRLWWVGTRALYFDVKTNQVGQRTLYASQMAPEPAQAPCAPPPQDHPERSGVRSA